MREVCLAVDSVVRRQHRTFLTAGTGGCVQGPRRRFESDVGPRYALVPNDEDAIAQNLREIQGPFRIGQCVSVRARWPSCTGKPHSLDGACVPAQRRRLLPWVFSACFLLCGVCTMATMSSRRSVSLSLATCNPAHGVSLPCCVHRSCG